MGGSQEYVMRDNHAEFGTQFDEVLTSNWARVPRNTLQSPDLCLIRND